MELASIAQSASDLWFAFRVDASYDLKRKVTGIGIVVGIRAKRKKTRPGPTVAELAEAYIGVPPDLCEQFAIFRALEVAAAHGARLISVGTDYNQLRRILKRDLKTGAGASRGGLHGEILRLASTFDDVRFPWLRRRKNAEAHRLSRAAVHEIAPIERKDVVWHQEA